MNKSETALDSKLSFKIFSSHSQLPSNWNSLATQNIFLSAEYFEILEKSAPINMTAHFIGLYQNAELVGIAISQFLDSSKLASFGDRDQCLKTTVRNFIFKNFASRVLFVGNNMLTGQNAYSFSDKIPVETAIALLKKATDELKVRFENSGTKVHLTTFKDFEKDEIKPYNSIDFKTYYHFSIQPNMVFEISKDWKSEQDYIDALSKKYRDQYKRARKKATGVEKRKLHLEEIIQYEDTIYDLYFHVAKNAPFNTFFLAKNHFRVFKEILKDKSLFYGYFVNNQLIGFNTLIKNGEDMDTYFLGYDDAIQKEKMLYLNMLYDMLAYSINKGFKKIIFARTALEIKSSIGAKPVKMFGVIAHRNSFLNKHIGKIFQYVEPEAVWKERHPFK